MFPIPQQLEIGQFTILMLDLQFPQKEESVPLALVSSPCQSRF